MPSLLRNVAALIAALTILQLAGGLLGARLPLSPHASCRDDCERRKGGALSQQQIFDTGTWQNSRNHQCAIHFAWDIFCAVNSDIDPFLD